MALVIQKYHHGLLPILRSCNPEWGNKILLLLKNRTDYAVNMYSSVQEKTCQPELYLRNFVKQKMYIAVSFKKEAFIDVFSLKKAFRKIVLSVVMSVYKH